MTHLVKYHVHKWKFPLSHHIADWKGGGFYFFFKVKQMHEINREQLATIQNLFKIKQEN